MNEDAPTLSLTHAGITYSAQFDRADGPIRLRYEWKVEVESHNVADTNDDLSIAHERVDLADALRKLVGFTLTNPTLFPNLAAAGCDFTQPSADAHYMLGGE